MYGLRGLSDASTTPSSSYPGCEGWFSRLINYPYCQTLEATQAQLRPVVYGQLPTPPASAVAPPPAIPDAYGTVAAPFDCAANPASDPSCPGYDAAINAALQAGASQTQQNMSDFFGQLNQRLNPPSSGINWWIVAGVGGVFVLGMVASR